MFLKRRVNRTGLRSRKRSLRPLARKNYARPYYGRGLYRKKMWKGRGLYEDKNVLIAGSENINPNISTSLNETGSIIVTHREYLSDVFAPNATFEAKNIPLNPGLNTSFPWLSQIASNYEEFEFKQLVFSFRSTTTDIGSSTTGQCGTMIMCTNYNASAPLFTDKQQMVEYAYAQSSKVTESMEHGVECGKNKVNNNLLFVRNGPVPPNQDIKTYDHGIFQYALANCPATFAYYPVGELWCYYTVVLRKPKLHATRGLDIMGDFFTVPQAGINGTSAGLTGCWGATSGDGSIMKCVSNSLGGKLTCTAISKVRYTLPSSFIGGLRIFCTISTKGLYNGSFGSFSAFLTGTSNIIQTNTLVRADLPNGMGAFINSTGKTTAETDPNVVVAIAEVYVKQVNAGSLSYIDMQYPLYTVGADTNTACVCALYVEQYQSFLNDASSNTEIPQFILQSTGLVTAR